MKRYRIYPNAVWCDAHGTHHGTDEWDGYYMAAGCVVDADECSRRDWRNLTILADSDEEF